MSNIWSTVGVIILGGAGWLVTEFVGRPFRKFYDLRGEVIQRSIFYSNVLAVQKEFLDGSVKSEKISDKEVERLIEAQGVFRDLAARMRAFELNERLALWFVHMRGYDPWKASETLFGVSNTLPTYGLNRHEAKQALERSLRFSMSEPQESLRDSWMRWWGKLRDCKGIRRDI